MQCTYSDWIKSFIVYIRMLQEKDWEPHYHNWMMKVMIIQFIILVGKWPHRREITK
jgi:hypothetical protein